MTLTDDRPVVSQTVSESGTVLYEWGTGSWGIVPPPDVLFLGYGNHSVADLIATLKTVDLLNPILVDIRLDPYSKREEWNKEALLSALLTSGNPCNYQHLPQFGNLNHLNRHLGVALANPESGLGYIQMVIREGYTPVLLCACGRPEGCHRSDVSLFLRQHGLTACELGWKLALAQPKGELISE